MPAESAKSPDQELVGGAEEVGELEVFVAKALAREVDDEVAELFVGEGRLADALREVDVAEHALEAGVLVLKGLEGFVEAVAHVLGDVVAEVGPPGLGGTKKESA